MSEEKELNVEVAASNSKPRVGDILRKERIARRIAIDAISKDLKINPRYIKALEENKTEELPAPAYIRVYLRSISRYLQLDSESIIRQYFQEQGLEDVFEKKQTAQGKASVVIQEKKTPVQPWVITVIIVLLLVVFVLIAQRMGLIRSQPINPVISSSASSSDSSAEAYFQQKQKDSLDEARVENVHEMASELDTVRSVAVTSSKKSQQRLRIEVIADSVWVQVFSDGKSWRNHIKANRAEEFTAVDSFNVRVGKNELVRYKLNGKPILIDGNGVAVFKIHNGKKEFWSLEKWQKVFKE